MYGKISLEAQVYVLTLAREGSFDRAAQKLNITQPALTRKIKEIESELGAKLFDRSHRHLELTATGKMFLPEAQASLQHAERAWELARQQARIERGPLRLGYSPHVHSDLLPLLQRFQTKNGTVRHVALESAMTTELKERVLQGTLDIAFGVSPVLDPDLWVYPVAREPFCLCVPKNHALAQKAALSIRDLHGETVCWLPRSLHPELHDRMKEYIDGVGVQPLFHQVSAVMEAMNTAAHGLALAFLPRSATHFSRTGIVCKPLTDLFLQIETAMFIRQDRRQELQEEFQAVLEHVKTVQRKMQ